MKFSSEITVDLIDFMGGDGRVVQTARASTQGARSEEQVVPGLINFLMREGHNVPMEHSVFTFRIHAPIFVTRQLLKHRMCLSGDTRVMRVDRNGDSVGSTNNQIAKMWELWHVGAYRRHGSGKEFRALLPNRKDMWVRSFTEDTLEPVTSRVIDIVRNGVKETVLVTTDSGKQIRATLDHKFFTPHGWKHLHELSVGDFTFRQGKIAVNTEPWIPPRLREGIALWSSSKRNELIPFDGTNCYICIEQFSFDDLELDHVIPVVEDLSRALDESNLLPACKNCHRKKTDHENGVRARLGSKNTLVPDRIVSISDPYEEETYDLVLEDPWHNFIAEGLSVHNSSISEESGRYRELEGEFYIPADDRPLVQVGKTGDYVFVEGDNLHKIHTENALKYTAEYAWEKYESLLGEGIAKEVARMVLPVNIYSTLYITVNAVSLMNIIRLRTQRFGSHPQHEVALVGELMYAHFRDRMPVTAQAFAIERGDTLYVHDDGE